MIKLPISVCIIAKNEEKYIEECLKRLQPYGFEIVVTDTGSQDRTKEIAHQYAARVLDYTWTDDFSAARNFCADHASNDWIIVLDCDEYVSDADLNTLGLFMEKVPDYTGVLRLKNLVNKEDGTQGYSVDDVIRMYDRRLYHYENPVHEQICPIDTKRRNEQMKTFLVPMEVIHHGYAISAEEMEKKQKRNLAILYQALDKNPEDAYLCFQIGQSEFILHHYEKAVTYYERGMELAPPLDAPYMQIMIMSLARAYIELDKRHEALELMNQYEKYYRTAKYTFTHASVYMDNAQPLKALLLYVKTTMLPDVDTLGEGLTNCYGNIIALYRDMGDEKMAALFRNKYEECLKEIDRVLNS